MQVRVINVPKAKLVRACVEPSSQNSEGREYYLLRVL